MRTLTLFVYNQTSLFRSSNGVSKISLRSSYSARKGRYTTPQTREQPSSGQKKRGQRSVLLRIPGTHPYLRTCFHGSLPHMSWAQCYLCWASPLLSCGSCLSSFHRHKVWDMDCRIWYFDLGICSRYHTPQTYCYY